MGLNALCILLCYETNRPKTQNVSLTIIKFISDELISDKSIYGFRKFC